MFGCTVSRIGKTFDSMPGMRSRHRRHASRERQVEHDVLCAGETMHENRRPRRDELRQAHAGAAAIECSCSMVENGSEPV